jgi:hypothetical protein
MLLRSLIVLLLLAQRMITFISLEYKVVELLIIRELDNQYSHINRSSVSGISVDLSIQNDFCVRRVIYLFWKVYCNNFNVRDLETYLYRIDAIQWESSRCSL